MTRNTFVGGVLILILITFAYIFLFARSDVPPTNESENTPSTINAKIDINAVCDGALAYMSFTDGAAADVFVSECKEGKHPEVIEQYKAQLNLGAGVAI